MDEAPSSEANDAAPSLAERLALSLADLRARYALATRQHEELTGQAAAVARAKEQIMGAISALEALVNGPG
jgi:hypothetical protein